MFNAMLQTAHPTRFGSDFNRKIGNFLLNRRFKMREKELFWLAVLTLPLAAACAGRDAHPVTTIQPHDTYLSCEQIQGEITGNGQKVKDLVEEKEDARSANVAVGVVGGLLFWPALFALDTSDSEDTEIAALRQRSVHLQQVYFQKGCVSDVRPSHTASVPIEKSPRDF